MVDEIARILRDNAWLRVFFAVLFGLLIFAFGVIQTLQFIRNVGYPLRN